MNDDGQFSILEDSGRTLQARVAKDLRDKIIGGQLLPGERLQTADIARQFGISRIPVREALHSLAADGFVRLSPQRGAFVAELSVEDIQEIYLLRKLLEPEAARRGTARLTKDLLRFLHQTVEAMEQDETDRERWQELDRTFHLSLYRASQLPRLYGMIETLRANSERYIAVYITSPNYRPGARQRHRELLDAYDAGDPELAARRTLEHLEEIERFFVKELRSKIEG